MKTFPVVYKINFKTSFKLSQCVPNLTKWQNTNHTSSLVIKSGNDHELPSILTGIFNFGTIFMFGRHLGPGLE